MPKNKPYNPFSIKGAMNLLKERKQVLNRGATGATTRSTLNKLRGK